MILGLSGGVGSGKSLVTEYLGEKYGALVIAADDVAREISEAEGPAIEAIREAFSGYDVFDDNGFMDRGKMGQLVFHEPQKRKVLEDILHPMALNEIRRRIDVTRKDDPNRLVALESAIFFESGCDQFCDEVWYIYTDKEVRIDRLISSRGYSREKCESIIASQMSEEELKRCSDRIIDNTGAFEETIEQIVQALG